MAPGRPVRDIVVKVPRHNADILRKDLAAKVHAAAQDEDMNVQLEQTPSEEVARAVVRPCPSIGELPLLTSVKESASEWNSLLMTARAERGPQWDIGTQQFHVDVYSDLYYDPTSLLASTRQALGVEEDEEPSTSPQDVASTSTVRRSHPARGAGMSPPRDMGMGMGGMGGAPPGMRPDMGDQVIGGMRMGNMGMGMNNIGRMGGMPANMAGNMPGGMGMGSMGMGGLPPG
ncbi:hypothetical protein EV122DRAFT_194106, partial [Schizophyllum commune]